MTVPKEIEKLTKQLFGKDVRISVTKNPTIQAGYRSLNNQVSFSKGFIEAYLKGYISLSDVRAILWHEHGEKIYFSYAFNTSRIMKRLIIPISILSIAIWLAFTASNKLIVEIIKNVVWLISLSYFISSFNIFKEYMCDIHSAIKMESTKFMINSLSKVAIYNKKIQKGLFYKLCSCLEELFLEHPRTHERITLLEALNAICDKPCIKGQSS